MTENEIIRDFMHDVGVQWTYIRGELMSIEFNKVSDNIGARQLQGSNCSCRKNAKASLMAQLSILFMGFMLINFTPEMADAKKIKNRPTVNVSHEYRLMGKLLENYATTARPRYNSSDVVEIMVRFSLQQIYDLDEKRQILRISGWLTAEWSDDFLVWDPAEYGNLSSVVVNPKHIWTPKMAIGNSATTMFQDWRHFLVTVRNDGSCRWQPGGIFAITCALDMNYYPFDEQHCTMELETWYYTADSVHLKNSMEVFGLETYTRHGEWAVVKTEVKQINKVYGYYADEAFPEVYFTIHMRRKYTFYFMYILLPCMMLSFVLVMVFLLPSESGEKVSLGVSILVAFSLFLLIVAEQVPDTSDAVPVMAIYLMYFMMATALSVMTSTLILKLHYGGLDRAAPNWLRVLMFDMVAPVLRLCDIAAWSHRHRRCVHRPYIVTKALDGRTQLNGHCRQDSNIHEALRKTTNVDEAPGSDKETITRDSPNNNSRNENQKKAGNLKRTLSIECMNSATLSPLGQPTRYNFSSHVDGGQCRFTFAEFVALEWKKISEVLDRLFFWLFMLFILLPVISLVAFVRAFSLSYSL